MKDLGKIIFYLIATVILGALLTPPLYWVAHWLASYGIQEWLAELPLRKFFNRGVLVAAIVLLWPTVRWLRLPQITDLGLQPNPHRWRDLTVGFLGSFLVMALFAVVLIQLGVFSMRKQILWWGLAQVCVSAVTVSLLEEAFFRGALMGLLMRSMSPLLALTFTSALYSIVHFLKPRDSAHTVYENVHWGSGFELIPGTFAQFADWKLVLGGFITLFFVGMILGITRLFTRSLWMAIGLHAGWILGKFGLSKIARRKIPESATMPWLGEDITIGIVSSGLVLLTGLLIALWFYHLYLKKTDASSASSPMG